MGWAIGLVKTLGGRPSRCAPCAPTTGRRNRTSGGLEHDDVRVGGWRLPRRLGMGRGPTPAGSGRSCRPRRRSDRARREGRAIDARDRPVDAYRRRRPRDRGRKPARRGAGRAQLLGHGGHRRCRPAERPRRPHRLYRRHGADGRHVGSRLRGPGSDPSQPGRGRRRLAGRQLFPDVEVRPVRQRRRAGRFRREAGEAPDGEFLREDPAAEPARGAPHVRSLDARSDGSVRALRRTRESIARLGLPRDRDRPRRHADRARRTRCHSRRHRAVGSARPQTRRDSTPNGPARRAARDGSASGPGSAARVRARRTRSAGRRGWSRSRSGRACRNARRAP